MSQQVVNTGIVANDGTGDTLYAAMNKINANFTDLYSGTSVNNTITVGNSVIVNNSLTVGNSSVNTYVNSTFVGIMTSTVNVVSNSSTITTSNALGSVAVSPTAITIGANGISTLTLGNSTVNAVSNNTVLTFSNSTVTSSYGINGANINSGSVYINLGNSTINSVSNSSSHIISNSTYSVSIGLPTVSIGNGSVNSTVNSTMVSSNTINATSMLIVGAPSGYNFVGIAPIEVNGNSNNYVEAVLQNANTGTNASGDFIATADSGNDSVNYVDLGINGSNYSNASYNIGGSLDGYLYTSNSNLVIGTAANNGLIKFHANGTTSADLKVTISANALTLANNVYLNGNVASFLGSVNAYSAQVTNGMYSVGQFNGTFTDGIVVDYVTNNGRISVGTGDALTFYTGGVATTTMAVINTIGISTGSGGGTATGGITISSSNVTIGNSTVNVSTNSTHFFAGNSTVYGFGNSTTDALVSTAGNNLLTPTSLVINSASGTGSVTVGNSSSCTVVGIGIVTIGNSTVNVSTNSTHFFAGNSTYYGFGNSTTDAIISPAGNNVLTPTSLTINSASGTGSVTVGNSTACTIIGIGTVSSVNATVTSNTLTLGTSTSAANGYTFLPNGLKMVWGYVAANATVGAVTFTSAFTTNAYSITATSNTPGGTYVPAVTAWTKTGATILTTNATSANIFWQAIGV